MFVAISGVASSAIPSRYVNLLLISLEIVVFTVNVHENICMAGLNRWAGHATGCYIKTV